MIRGQKNTGVVESTHCYIVLDKRANKSKSDIKLFDKFPGDLGQVLW